MVKICPRCSVDNRDGADFCFRCGTKFPLAEEGTVARQFPLAEEGTVARPIAPSTPRPPMPGMCSYHPNLPAIYTCNKCGKPICLNCAKKHMNLVFCCQCHTLLFQSTPPSTFPAHMPWNTWRAP